MSRSSLFHLPYSLIYRQGPVPELSHPQGPPHISKAQGRLFDFLDAEFWMVTTFCKACLSCRWKRVPRKLTSRGSASSGTSESLDCPLDILETGWGSAQEPGAALGRHKPGAQEKSPEQNDT